MKCCTSSRARDQRERSRRDITCAKIRKIINNSAEDRSISLKFRTDLDHLKLDVPRTFKVNGSKLNVTFVPERTERSLELMYVTDLQKVIC